MFHPGKSVGSYILSEYQDKRSPSQQIERRLATPFVTVSRQVGAYGHTFAELLSAYLKKHERRAKGPWSVCDRDLVQTVIEENRYPKEIAPFLGEVPLAEVTDMIEEIFGVHPSQWTLVHRMSEAILRLAQGGYVIIVGRGANIITRKFPGGIHVRLIGSLEKRLAHFCEYYRLPAKKGRQLLLKQQRERRGFIKKYFFTDIENPLLYHHVINTDEVRIEDAAELIGGLVLRAGGPPAGHKEEEA